MPRRNTPCLTAFAALLLLLSSPCPAQPPRVEKRPAEFEVAIEKNVMIAVRDGPRLAADLYRPLKGGAPVAGRRPTLLTRTPYDKNGAEGDARYYAARGYNVVANDVRGRYASEGIWRMMADDP